MTQEKDQIINRLLWRHEKIRVFEEVEEGMDMDGNRSWDGWPLMSSWMDWWGDLFIEQEDLESTLDGDSLYRGKGYLVEVEVFVGEMIE